MGPPVDALRALARRCTPRPVGRILVGLLAASAVLAIAPGVSPAQTAGSPTFTQTNLVSDLPGMAGRTDPNLVNPWGMTLGLNSGLWVSDNGSGKATTYDSTGQPIPSGSPTVVTIPAPGGTGSSSPTGVATNGTSGFVISSGGQSAPSTELFATEDGTIAGWNGNVDPTHAVIAVDNSASGAVYKGLAIGFNAAGAFLFATNFHAGTVDVFDSSFHPVHIAGAFTDKKIPSSFAPFGISAINSDLYVTYAKQDASRTDDTAGIDDEQHGLFGKLTVNPSSLPPPEGPTMLDPNLRVSTVVSGLNQPTSMAFLGPNDFFVLEKASGKVQHVVNGNVHTVLTLPVNSFSERGLLGIALQPNFTQTHGVYLYWTQSQSGTVSSDAADVPLLGNRVDRYVWDPSTQTLTFDKNLIMLRSFQADANQPLRGNHDAGKILFGPDGKLYFQIGDQGRG